MSFAATTAQMWAGSKTVTRRDPATWARLAPGDRVMAIEKGMGLPAGAKQVTIRPIEIVSNELVALGAGDDAEAAREGFESWVEFAATWQRLHGRYDPFAMVRRIEFVHVFEQLGLGVAS